MKTFFCVLLTHLFLVSSLRAQTIKKTALYGAVYISGASKVGHGVVIGSHKDSVFILTARHVVEANEDLGVLFDDVAGRIPAKVIHLGGPEQTDTTDFAVILVQVKRKLFPVVRPAQELNPGDDIFIFRPEEKQQVPRTNSGMLSEESDLFYSIYLPGVSPGDSGSGLMIRDKEGRIAGILVRETEDYNALVLKAGFIEKFIKKYWKIQI